MRVLLEKPGEDKGLTADLVAALLKPSYSVLGSNRRAREELIVVKFREFLQCVESKYVFVIISYRVDQKKDFESPKANYYHTYVFFNYLKWPTWTFHSEKLKLEIYMSVKIVIYLGDQGIQLQAT